ncbi:hypothetical protein [Chryseobacterium indologenes]|uniref:hypothetical protein n=1 Tax=Chryseobacterium indologenes TaxID=253 RepID=UPI001E57D9D8|nr:hypothetical protein [Chryseobacterium indologenes]
MTILLLLVAQVVILGHSFVPHHHHTDLASQQHNHHHDQDSKNQHPEESSLELAFSGFIHSGEQITFTQTDGAKIVITKQALQAIDALPNDFTLPAAHIVSYQKHTFPPDRHIKYPSPLYGAYTLRGPPSFIVA